MIKGHGGFIKMADLSNRLKSGLALQDYYPEAARNVFSPAEARREYNRLRRLANKRLEELQRHYPASSMAREYAAGFPALGSDGDRRLYQRLYRVARFLSSKLGSVTGMRQYRKRMIASLHEAGYDFVNESNFNAFTDFMDEVKTHRSYSDYASEEIVELFGEAVEKNADPVSIAEAFEYWIDREEVEIPEEEQKKLAARPKPKKEKAERPRTQRGSTSSGRGSRSRPRGGSSRARGRVPNRQNRRRRGRR